MAYIDQQSLRSAPITGQIQLKLSVFGANLIPTNQNESQSAAGTGVSLLEEIRGVVRVPSVVSMNVRMTINVTVGRIASVSDVLGAHRRHENEEHKEDAEELKIRSPWSFSFRQTQSAFQLSTH